MPELLAAASLPGQPEFVDARGVDSARSSVSLLMLAASTRPGAVSVCGYWRHGLGPERCEFVDDGGLELQKVNESVRQHSNSRFGEKVA